MLGKCWIDISDNHVIGTKYKVVGNDISEVYFWKSKFTIAPNETRPLKNAQFCAKSETRRFPNPGEVIEEIKQCKE